MGLSRMVQATATRVVIVGAALAVGKDTKPRIELCAMDATVRVRRATGQALGDAPAVTTENIFTTTTIQWAIIVTSVLAMATVAQGIAKGLTRGM